MGNTSKSSNWQVVRTMAVISGLILVAWVLLFSDIRPTESYFSVYNSAEARSGSYDASELGRLKLLLRCVGFIRSGYVVPERVKPMEMFAGALKAAEAVVPDLMVTFNAPKPADATSVEVRVGDLTRVFVIEKTADLHAMSWRLQDIFTFVAKNLPPDVKPEDVEYAAINGILEPLDEHSVFLPPEAYQQMQLDTQGRFGGLGLVISSRAGYVTVMSVMDDTPAKAAGLKSGDQIIEIDSESTMNMPLNDAVSMLRGEPGTTVRITLNRKGWSEPKSLTLTRAEIEVRSVKTEALGNGVAYARLLHFQEDTATDLANQLEALRKKGSLKGIVLDLRENPGGLLDQAIEVGDLFLKSGTLVVTQGEGNRMREEYEAGSGEGFEKTPLVVLIDGGSASAAEIVAGALKYNNRAILLGTTTYGKGTVQVMHEVGAGALKLTVAQYLIPGDLSIQGVGVVPDMELVPTLIGKNSIVTGLPDYKRFKDPDRGLDAFGKVASDVPSEIIQYLAKTGDELDDESDEMKEPPVKDDVFEKDEAIELAAEIALAIPSGRTRQEQIEAARPVVSAFRLTHDADISKALQAMGVDWTSGPLSRDAQIATTFTVLSGESSSTPPGDTADPAPATTEVKLVAGTQAVLKMSVTNNGAEPLFRVRCALKSDNSLVDGREFLFGAVAPGATVTREIRFKVPREMWDRRDRVELSVYQNAVEPISGTGEGWVSFSTIERPRFGFIGHVIDSEGNGDGILNPGEKARLVFVVGNRGRGDSPKTMVSLSNKSGERLYLRSGRETIENGIVRDSSTQVKFALERRQDSDESPIKVEISVLDLAIREYLSEEIELPSSAQAGQPFKPASGFVQASQRKVPIRVAASEGALVAAEVEEGVTLRTDGFLPGFYRVEMEGGLWGFVASTDVIIDNDGKDAVTPASMLTNIAPDIAVSFEPSGDVVHVRGSVEFFGENEDVRRKVLIFREDDKVYFWTRKGPLGNPVVQVDATVDLREGRNALAIYAVEGVDRSSARRFNLFLPKTVTPESGDSAVPLTGAVGE
ncbi:MAG TPA: MXAN_5808 family serine peptidase [Myxococcota bacterium]|nr:MXAN_5808 family serine peptidase [Myxococcota bacterium]HQP96435.1 MXAN_5808 family serine peptidase [Myxococcota bacterium]